MKQTLLAHLLSHHPRMLDNRCRPADARGALPKLTLKQLQRIHKEDHYRYRPKHVHWDGTDEDRNLGPGNRPVGWETGENVREK